MKQLDRTDHRILHMLQQNAKLTIKEISGELGMTTTPVYERIKRMEEDGYIRGYIALLDRNKLGLKMVVFCSVRLQQQSQDSFQKFEEEIKELNEVIKCYHIAGDFDYLLHVIIADMNAFQDFRVNKLAVLVNIGHVQTSFVMSEVKDSNDLPF